MTEEVSLEEARKRLGNLVDEVRYTRRAVIITRHGKPVARLVPMEDSDEIDQTQLAGIPGAIKRVVEIAVPRRDPHPADSTARGSC